MTEMERESVLFDRNQKAEAAKYKFERQKQALLLKQELNNKPLAPPVAPTKKRPAAQNSDFSQD